MDGDPPDLPREGFSNAARDFVQGCLNKTPKLRPTYAMLLRHAWLAPLLKPPTISEEDEETSNDPENEPTVPSTADKEVAKWVCNALDRKQNNKVGKKTKPALHAAPLNAVSNSMSNFVQL